ncbi:ACP S-malonyltransferase [Micromonospora parathelypteridis]|uniref:[acyl-carrier-protein] S-malonyltransferase n=1 Tax=Micromonospora parathelypteridis TaxID=1839617 RepID=A0A840VH29_9ACTN|nr:ACP S-malonyltransferase [Micromonospora parathelypteridis]MBB5476132.1 [acyl-carrier-protein] S-malonyltransferase [Micromonospora parathelypteridis]
MEQKTAVVFPGMGPSNFSTVGRFMVLDPYARRRIATTDEVLGYSLLDRFYESDDDYSEYTQIAFLVNSVALADRAVAEGGMRADVCAGPSFGQKAAAYWAGSMDFGDVVRMTAELARCERDYFADQHTDVVTHSFVRVPEDRLQEYLDDLTRRGGWYDISGRLDRGFLMLSIRAGLLDELKQAISDMGGYSMYTMRPPVHAAIFDGLRRRAEESVIGRYAIEAPRMPVIADQDGRLVTTADDMQRMLLDTFDRPIDWPAMVATLIESGVKRMYITGPENLFRRVDCTRRNFEVVNVDPKAALRTLLTPA